MTARNLIINVDDLGIHAGAVDAAVETITHGAAASGSVMAVCPGTSPVLELLAAHPEVPVGVHLTLTADYPDVPWFPLTRGRSIQEQGKLLGNDQIPQLLAQADIAEVEAEFRAQIELLMTGGLHPTHLDWHCLADGGRDDIFDLTLALADEYRTAVGAWFSHGRDALRARGSLVQDHPFLDSFEVPIEGKQHQLIERLRALPEGLTEWAVHPARPASTNTDSAVRTTDYEFLMAASTREALREEGIAVLGWGDPRLRA